MEDLEDMMKMDKELLVKPVNTVEVYKQYSIVDCQLIVVIHAFSLQMPNCISVV